jgi:hypothetical protein
MIYVKSLLAGLAALILIAALIVGALYLAPFVIERLPSSGQGGVGFDVYENGPWVSIWVLAIAPLCVFVGVSYWAFRRASKAAGRSK